MLQVSSYDFEPTFIICFVIRRVLPNKNKSPNIWHITSILVCCIFGPPVMVPQVDFFICFLEEFEDTKKTFWNKLTFKNSNTTSKLHQSRCAWEQVASCAQKLIIMMICACYWNSRKKLKKETNLSHEKHVAWKHISCKLTADYMNTPGPHLMLFLGLGKIRIKWISH